MYIFNTNLLFFESHRQTFLYYFYIFFLLIRNSYILVGFIRNKND